VNLNPKGVEILTDNILAGGLAKVDRSINVIVIVSIGACVATLGSFFFSFFILFYMSYMCCM
jgi:hypothetical protein